jgi:hypothetical protein
MVGNGWQKLNAAVRQMVIHDREMSHNLVIKSFVLEITSLRDLI